MKITKIIFNDFKKDSTKPKAVCSVVLDDCLKLNGIHLYSGEEGYYLVLPSCEDIYQKIQELNPELEIVFPSCIYVDEAKKKKYEELYHPLSSKLYHNLLSQVIRGYEIMRETGNHAYIVEN